MCWSVPRKILLKRLLLLLRKSRPKIDVNENRYSENTAQLSTNHKKHIGGSDQLEYLCRISLMSIYSNVV